MTQQELLYYLSGNNDKELFEKSAKIRIENIGTKTYLRGLIELSNRCACDCLYCGIRASNSNVIRYSLNEEDVVEAAKSAYEMGWGSVVMQCGELRTEEFAKRIERLTSEVKRISNQQLAITLSCGEQSKEVYRRWKDAGADRYLLRIESSNQELFKKIHPKEIDFHRRAKAIDDLLELDYQVGSGVMIGLPDQTLEDLANDLLWIKQSGAVMVGMGPYLEHHQTPLFSYKSQYSHPERLKLTLRMIALLRIMMPKINIASSTALSTLDSNARYQALEIGANVLMPNITPMLNRKNYSLYENKSSDLDLEGIDIEYFTQGNSLAYGQR